MWMSAGFTMLEAGSVRTKNASMICLKNIGLYSIAGLAYFIVGYNLMYGEIVGNFIGKFALFYGPSAAEIALINGEGAVAAVVRRRERLLHDVRLVLPDGLRRGGCVHRVGRLGRAGQALVVLSVHVDPDGNHLPHRRRLDLGAAAG